ncbi:MAG: hypothetical protein A4E74_02132 [Syntrophus sp. PtaB.Bin075]|nr:MAG: hypothetical protein A4E74_02132 [Syntrophus sp. PtaB.Bin075]
MTSPALTPIFLARSPTVMASPTRILLLIALGTVISVFFILTGAAFFSSFQRGGLTARSMISSSKVPRKSVFSGPFLRTVFFLAGICSPFLVSSGSFIFFLGFSASVLGAPFSWGTARPGAAATTCFLAISGCGAGFAGNLVSAGRRDTGVLPSFLPGTGLPCSCTLSVLGSGFASPGTAFGAAAAFSGSMTAGSFKVSSANFSGG